MKGSSMFKKLRIQFVAIVMASDARYSYGHSADSFMKQINGAEKYQVYYYNAANKKFSLLGETGNNYATIRQLKPATLYKYRVRAVSVASDGTRIQAATSKTYTAYTVPGAVKNLKVRDLTTTSYRLQWDAAAGATGYIVYRFDETSGSYTEVTKTAVPSCSVRALTPGTTDYYQICAYATLQKVNRACGQKIT